MIRQALIIAAGAGSRLQNGHRSIPKPLIKVGGLMLIERAILSAERAGVEECVVVVGYEGERIRQALAKKSFRARLIFVENPDWRRSNGLSVLAASLFLDERFFLMMADHIFDAKLLARLSRVCLGQDAAVLCVDHRLADIFDPEDATKVALQGDRVLDIGKDLKTYQAVDCGLFLASRDLLVALQQSIKDEDCSLSDGIRTLATVGRMRALGVEDHFWQDVDTQESKQHAEWMLLHACRKPTDGFISRHCNRRVSLTISRLLMNTPITANQMTGLTSLVGLISGLLVARGDYFGMVLGAILFKLSSILDGCDGELAKLKLSASRLGQWLDTASDNATYVIFLLGVMVGLFKQGDPHALTLALTTVFGLCMTLGMMFSYLTRKGQSGSLIAVQNYYLAQTQAQPKRWYSWFARVQFLMKRDVFSVVFLLLALVGSIKSILILAMVGTNVTWMVFLAVRLVEIRTTEALGQEKLYP